MEELRRIQEQEKTGDARGGRDMQASRRIDPERMRMATRAGETAAAKAAVLVKRGVIGRGRR